MNKNLANVAVVLVVILAAVALGLMWGVSLYPYLYGSNLETLAVTARPAVSIVVLAACGVAVYARTLREPMPVLVGLIVTQLVVSIAYGVLVWWPHSSFVSHPVG